VKSARFLFDDAYIIANVTGNAHYYFCNDCSLNLPLGNPDVVVDALMGMWPL
jgi:hypothetical protein